MTVVGTAGVGKSRLVLEAARELAHTREVWYVELAPVTDPVAVPEAVASTLGARDEPSLDDASAPRRPHERTITRLADRPAVLILDNCEHVIDGRCDMAGHCSLGVRSLVGGGYEPRAARPSTASCRSRSGRSSEADAVQLFTERARAVQPLFRPDDGADDLRQLCRHLDGLPLAIELAAARAKTLPVRRDHVRLDHRFELAEEHEPADPDETSGAERGARCQLRAAVRARAACVPARWRCSPAVSRSTPPRRCAARTPSTSVSALVDSFHARGRHLRTRSPVPDAASHFAQYGVERLARAPASSRRSSTPMSRWCIDLAEAVDVEIRGPGQLQALDRLDAEHDNLRAALAHLSVADPNRGLRLIGGAASLSWFAADRRHETRHWAEACLAGAVDPPPAALALALAGVGLMPESSGWSGIIGELESELDLAQRRLRLGSSSRRTPVISSSLRAASSRWCQC